MNDINITRRSKAKENMRKPRKDSEVRKKKIEF